MYCTRIANLLRSSQADDECYTWIMHICIIGTGFVGVVSAAVYASFGNQVVGLDIDENKVAALRQGHVPFFEPNLEELLIEQQQTGNLTFTTDYQSAISQAEIVIIAVGTPSAPDGQADLKFVLAATDSLAPHLKEKAIVVVKSTVPPGTLETVTEHIKKLYSGTFYTASVPEFLREGSAVQDTLHPDRVVLGATDEFVFTTLEQLHKPLQAPIVKISPESAQMAKYAANSYLAVRITFANQIADLCEKNGADIQEVIAAISKDKRIGSHYWYPGLGYGGSCFPKDVKELAAYSRAVGEANNLFNKVDELNDGRIPRLMASFAENIGGWQGKKVALLGLAFKPNTDDMREAPSIKLVPWLIEQGATVTGYDPKAIWAEHHPDKRNGLPALTQTDTIAAACGEADVIIAAVEWSTIVNFDFSTCKATKDQWFIDARNQFSPKQVTAWGYHYRGVGR